MSASTLGTAVLWLAAENGDAGINVISYGFLAAGIVAGVVATLIYFKALNKGAASEARRLT